jgi:NADH-quinone oxidoreductase subunit E
MINPKEIEQAPKLQEIVTKYPREQRFALAILQDIQGEYNYLPRESLYFVADYLQVPLSKLYSMATFYKALSLKKKGENIIKVCDGTACHIRSSVFLIREIENVLGIKPGDTSENGKFSLETVSCLGACALAPVLVVNEQYYGSVTGPMLREILRLHGGIHDGD